MKTLLALFALATTASVFAQTTPQITSWQTGNSGRYARQYTTTANRTAGTSATTWTGHTNPSYSDVYEVWYDTTYVYVKYTGLPSYAIGPWLQPDGTTPGTIMPLTQNVIRRFPRTPVVPAITAKSSTSPGTSGLLVNGVHIFNALDGQAWSGTAIVGMAQHTTATYYWHRVAPVAEAYNFDYAQGHSNPPGAYHNHHNPQALRYQLGDHVDYNASTKVYTESTTTPTAHSPILGWAHDGYPVYGPYGYSTATNASSGIRRMVSGYVKRDGTTIGSDSVITNNSNMPAWYLRYRTNKALGGTTNPVSVARSTNTTTYPIGTFAEDHAYLGDLIKTGATPYAQGTDFDLDEYNGRFCYTPEYPAGTYAYFTTIDASGNGVFPYILNFEHYGTAAATPQQTVTTITGATNYVTAGPAKAISFTNTPNASGGSVTMTWNSVEGGSYTVENSTNQSTWTTKATGVTATSQSNTTANTFTTIGSSGTEYARVTRTALATYDAPTVATAVTVSQTATGTYTAGANNAPTLTTISTLNGASNGTAFTIDYATLAAAANEADADGNAISFRVEAVSNGTLTKSGSAVTAGTTLLSTSESWVWTPSGTGTIAAFTVKAYDGSLASSTAIAVNIVTVAGNNIPTLTTINTLTGATEDTAFTISYTDLANAANEADLDGQAISFRIEAITSGTLSQAVNSTLSTGGSLTWTPALNANGTLAAFTVKAHDGIAASSTAITVNVSVAAVADTPTLNTISTLGTAVLNTAFSISYTTLAAAADEADGDGTTPSFLITAVNAGTLSKAVGSTLAVGETMTWTPATGFTGTANAFSVKATDGTLTSATAVNVNITVALTAGDPQLTAWHTANTGKYARITETDASSLAGTSVTTWTRTTGGFTLSQTSPVYAGIQQVDYSASWIYFRTPSLATYTMGPWYNDAARTTLFLNVPKNMGSIVRIPRSSTLGAIPTTKTRTAGFTVGGVLQQACGWLVDGVSVFDPNDGFGWNGTADAGPATGSWHRDAYVNEGITFDKSLAHQQNLGTYHNHANPIGLRYQLGDAVAFNSTTKAYSETMAPTAHSPVIGWMLDGLPIYGPYGYSTALNANSGVRRMVGGFVKRDGATTGVDNINSTGATRTLPAWATRLGLANTNGPAISTTYPFGRYIQDWAYLGDLTKAGGGNYTQGTDFDLNEYNVRYCVTPEFPSGTWAYFLNITSTGTPQFPYMSNIWYFGTPTGSTVTTISENVTNQFTGGANRPLTIDTPVVASPNVTLTWNAVEGGTYSVDASANNSTWSSKATGLTVSNANTKSNTHATLGTTGTEYARVNRTALATYDATGTVAATVAQTTSTSFNLGSTATAPTLTTISTLSGANEDAPSTLSYATLLAASNAADANGDAISFRIESVTSGTLTLSGANVAPGTSLVTSADSLVWTPAENANGTLAAFTVKAWDGALASATAVQVNVSISAVNDAPTLSVISNLADGVEDTAMSITYAMVAAAANEADVDGTALSFRVAETFSGTLTKNGVAVAIGTLLSAGDTMLWTPPGNGNGMLTAMDVVASDGALESGTALGVQAYIAPVNDAPIINDLADASGTEDIALTISHAAFAVLANEFDVDGDAISFRIESVSSGTLTKNGSAITPGSTLLSSGESIVWTPPTDVNGHISAFTIKAWDGELASDATHTLFVNLTAVNDAPTLTSISTLTGATEDEPFGIHVATLETAANEADAESGVSFRIESVTSGTLTKGGIAVTPGTTLISEGESVAWTPAANANGTLAAFTVKAWDGEYASATAVQVNVSVAPVADAPVWDGGAGTGAWATGANWIDNSVPFPAQTVSFTGATPTSITLGADRLIGGMNLSGDNAYSFTGNTLTLGVGGNFITSNPSTGSVTHTISSAVSLDGTAVINTASNAGLEIGGGVSGSQAVTKSGAGTLTLTGASSYSGTLTVSEGTLAMGKHNDASTSGGSLNAATIINNSAVFTALNGAFSGNMSGSGSWTVQGRNSSLGGIYTGAATHTGGTTISTSSLTLGDGGTSGSVTGNFTLVNGGLLTINHSDAVTLAGTISGDGEVWNGDTGALSLTGAVSVNVLASSSSGALHVSSTCAATNGYIGIGSTGSSLNGNSSAAQMTFTYLSIGTAGSAAVNLSGGADLTTGDIEFGSTGDGIGSLSLINSGTSLTCTGGITGTATSSIRIRGGSTLTTASLTSVPVSMDTFGTLVFSAATTCDSAFTLGIAGGYLSNAVAVTLSGPINGPLSKAGSGTLTLTGTNSLTDSLVIDAGTLTLSSISISDSADVYIAAAATLNLNFTGTDTVNQLSIGTVQQSAGTWGSLTSSATHKTARITGNGILLVTNGPDDFTDWAAQYGLTLTEADFDLDSDNDGIDNGLEFVLGGNPATSDTAAQPITSSVSGGYHTLTFHRYDGSERDINLDVEYSTNLTTWTPIIIGSSSSTSGGVIITVTENGSSMDLITVQMPVGVNTRMFSRIFAEVD